MLGIDISSSSIAIIAVLAAVAVSFAVARRAGTYSTPLSLASSKTVLALLYALIEHASNCGHCPMAALILKP